MVYNIVVDSIVVDSTVADSIVVGSIVVDVMWWIVLWWYSGTMAITPSIPSLLPPGPGITPHLITIPKKYHDIPYHIIISYHTTIQTQPNITCPQIQ